MSSEEPQALILTHSAVEAVDLAEFFEKRGFIPCLSVNAAQAGDLLREAGLGAWPRVVVVGLPSRSAETQAVMALASAVGVPVIVVDPGAEKTARAGAVSILRPFTERDLVWALSQIGF
ncbi:hypothetical protein [Tropicibacter naphthalenivorans]|uniref:Response regulatory domain-containing protein n=1 Tax=Tropicibacter naphthalenivorans TaxID=441103 RepID=A0A0P1GLP7_9RHOB|nr:hypothetical protein [Tropicibacter naphthalenivorans]CUH75621.1 hypothetical protein TRN7648_00531 [Tropicibacter naphthalenivorans]SMC43173.1 hypothetical protein SAMN04488093_101348 [Tropicibacter naphthalenivorans]